MLQSSMNTSSSVPAITADIADWINSSLGIFFSERKYPILFHKLSRVCVNRHMDLDGIWQGIRAGNDPVLLSEVAAAVSTNHTSFFREDIWDYFSGTVLPSLPQGEAWRIWSAAASSGHEAYTIAMLAAEFLDAAQAVKMVGILGTDISFKVLREAEKAVYTEDMVTQVPDRFRNVSFEPAGKGLWQVKKHLREMALFRRLNLKVRPWPMKQKFHVIFCRNVLYYFDSTTRQGVIDGLYRHAEQGAWLITSATETMRDLKTNWKSVRPAVYRK